MAKPNPDLTISDLSGGIDDTSPPTAVAQDQCLEAVNIEFFDSALGEKRGGCEVVSLSGSSLATQPNILFLHRHTPNSDDSATELWAISGTPSVSSQISRKTTAWSDITPSLDALTTANIHNIHARSLHGKLFFAYKTAVNRLHVWDGTTLRRVGLAMPGAAPTAADSGGAGSMTGIRYYRIRYTVQSSGTTLLRSEPSDVLTHTPGGANASITVTKPTTIGESETHWELEASLDNAFFYRIATTVVGTTTVVDSVAFSTGYAVSGTLSEDSGDYTVPTSCRFLSVDEDRLIMGGSWMEPSKTARVSWTPVFGDPGVGNDERIPIDTNNFIDLDTYEGGDLTGLSDAINGYFYAFKRSHIYKFVRTGQRLNAYDAFPISKRRGALQNSIVAGVDQLGNPALYFLDPEIGPCRIGNQGLQTCSADIQTLWQTVNTAAFIPCAGVYYPKKKQVIWWIATGVSEIPNVRITLQTNKCREGVDGVRKGWTTATTVSYDGLYAAMYSDNVNAGVARSFDLKPITGAQIGGLASILMQDIGYQDIAAPFYSKVVTRPYVLAGILNKFGVMAGAILAKTASGVTVFINAVRDFGLEESTPLTADLTAVGSETDVIRPLDSLNFSELRSLHFEYGDDPEQDVEPAGHWEINQIAVKIRSEERA